MDINLEALGFTHEEIRDRIVDRIAQHVIFDEANDEYGPDEVFNEYGRELQQFAKEKIDQVIAELFEGHVLPDIRSRVDGLILQKTNEWGEPESRPLTFIEYLVKRSEAYLHEKVNYEGKSKDEARGFSWTASQTRLTHLVNEHLKYEISRAMESAVQTVQSAIAPALAETVKIQLKEISEKLKVEVKTGR